MSEAALQRGRRLAIASQPFQKIAMDARQQVVPRERPALFQGFHRGKGSRGPEGHGYRDGAVQRDEGRRRDVFERRIERRNSHPVGFLGDSGPRMTSRNRCLKGQPRCGRRSNVGMPSGMRWNGCWSIV